MFDLGPVDNISADDEPGVRLPVRKDQRLIGDGLQRDSVGEVAAAVSDWRYADLAGRGDRDNRPVRSADADGVWCVVYELHAPFPLFSIAFAIRECFSAFVEGNYQSDCLAFQVLNDLFFSKAAVFHSGFCKSGYGFCKVRDDIFLADVESLVCFEAGSIKVHLQRSVQPDVYVKF